MHSSQNFEKTIYNIIEERGLRARHLGTHLFSSINRFVIVPDDFAKHMLF
jgi:hypothetical protein